VEGLWLYPNDIGHFFLTFREGNYFIESTLPGVFDQCSGLYTTTNGLIVLKYPDQIYVDSIGYGYDSHEIKWLFPNHNDISLTLDIDYNDFYSKTCLRNNGRILTNG
jgi:hypothetical protein